MIAPMKKITLLTLDSEREKAVKSLRKLGLVHVESKSNDSKSVIELKSLQNKIALCMSVLNEACGKKKANKATAITKSLTDDEANALLDEIVALNEKRKENSREIAQTLSKIKEYAPFGKIDPKDFEYLREKGVTLALGQASEKQYRGLFTPGVTVKSIEKSELDVVRLGVNKKRVLFLLVGVGAGLPANIDSSISILPLPECSTDEYEKQVQTLLKENRAIGKKLVELGENLPLIENYSKYLAKRIDFESVYEGMTSYELSEQTGVATLTGYVPSKDIQAVKSFAAENSWGLISDDPVESDLVPTKLEGNAITKIIHPLFDFLDTYPGYFEIDISWTVLAFFAMFVAMIFADAGYALLTLLISVSLAVKTKLSGKSVPYGLRMFIYLAVVMLVWGMLSCSWFGVDPAVLPEVLRSIAIPGISGMVEKAVQNNNIMLVAFSVGLAHLVIAHLISIFTNKINLKTLSNVGAILMLIGMYFVVLNILRISVGSLGIIPISTWMLACLGVGFLLDFVFCNYEGSIGASVLASVKDIITKLLGIVNVFSDIMSYVRLWAVGLAGASIMMTVNNMASPMLAKAVLFAFGVLVCVFGHGLNMVLNVLSVLVHAVRLNVMEFAGHAGLGLTGFKYNPFREE